MVYRISIHDRFGLSEGYKFVSGYKNAVAVVRRHKDTGYKAKICGKARIPRTTEEFMSLLEDWASHNDNG